MAEDRRVARTRTALIEAFNHLVLSRRKKQIRVADIVARANVGRSTFYEHYRSADQLHLEALARPLAMLADAAVGQGDEARLANLLDHFWENRGRARDSLTGRQGERVSRMLADMVEQRLAESARETAIPRRLAAIQLTEAAFAPVRGWLTAEASSTAPVLAHSICRCGQQLVAALTRPCPGEGRDPEQRP
jgi:AcrR family transcriptional regulator